MPYIWYSYLYSVKWLHLLDQPSVLENVHPKSASFQKQASLNLLPDLITKKGSLYTKQKGYHILLYSNLK